MNSIPIKAARQQFARLINAARRGHSTALTHRGQPVAQINPIQPAVRPPLPDLTAFRASLAAPRKKPAATIRRLRDQERS